MLIFTFYVYLLPTKHDYSFAVIFETILLGQIIVMLSLKTTNYIQDSLEQTVNSVAENDCQNTQVPLTKLALVLLVLYYIPVVIILLYLTFRLIRWINCLKWIRTKRYLAAHIFLLL